MTETIAAWLFIVSFVLPPVAVAAGAVALVIRKAVTHPGAEYELPTAA